MSEEKLYHTRDIESQGRHYIKHIDAMTSENLRNISDIAAELAHRDIAALKAKALIMCNIRNFASIPKKTKNWVLYSRLFGTGSITAQRICLYDLGIAPDGCHASLEAMFDHIEN